MSDQFIQPPPQQQGWIHQQVPPPQQPPRKSTKTRNFFIAVGIIAATLIGIRLFNYFVDPVPGETSNTVLPQAISRTMTVQGGVAVPAFESYASEGDTCTTGGGYSDIAPGIQVTIQNDTGKQVGFGPLGTGVMTEGMCRFPFEIGDVPKGEAVYNFEVSDRGQVSYHELDLTSGTIELRIGE